jgi:hypothetical protein
MANLAKPHEIPIELPGRVDLLLRHHRSNLDVLNQLQVHRFEGGGRFVTLRMVCRRQAHLLGSWPP